MCVCRLVYFYDFGIAYNPSFQDSLYACTVDFSKLRLFGSQLNIFYLIAFWSDEDTPYIQFLIVA